MDWGWVPVPHPPFHTHPAKDPRRSLEDSLKTLTFHECIPPITCPGLESHATSLYPEDHRRTHPCRRRIQSHPGCSLGASSFYLCLKKKKLIFCLSIWSDSICQKWLQPSSTPAIKWNGRGEASWFCVFPHYWLGQQALEFLCVSPSPWSSGGSLLWMPSDL